MVVPYKNRKGGIKAGDLHPSCRRHPPHIKQAAKEMYLCTDKKIGDISKILEVPTTTIQSWIVQNKWSDERRKLEVDLQERSSYEIAKVLRENVGQVVRRHLEVGRLLEEHVRVIVEKANKNPEVHLKPSDLMDLAKGFNQSAKITGNTVGVGKATRFGGSETPVGVSLLINTNFSPTPIDKAPVDQSYAIDVESEDVQDSPGIDPECGF